MKVLAALFGLAFVAGVFFVVRRGGAEGGRLEGAFGFGLIAIAALGWSIQVVVEVIDRVLRARKRRS
jgi:drug/metabolite transporter (DMT)-like permease